MTVKEILFRRTSRKRNSEGCPAIFISTSTNLTDPSLSGSIRISSGVWSSPARQMTAANTTADSLRYSSLNCHKTVNSDGNSLRSRRPCTLDCVLSAINPISTLTPAKDAQHFKRQRACEEVFLRSKSIKGHSTRRGSDCTCFFILGLVSWKVLAVGSRTSYLNSVYDRNDRHKWLRVEGFKMKPGKRQRHCRRKRNREGENFTTTGAVGPKKRKKEKSKLNSILTQKGNDKKEDGKGCLLFVLVTCICSIRNLNFIRSCILK